jgi:hypothetical protein
MLPVNPQVVSESMEELSGENRQPFTLRPVEIWENLSQRQRMVLVAIYEMNEQAETAEHHRLKQGKLCRHPDHWRWIPYQGNTAGEPESLEARLSALNLVGNEAYKTIYILEDQGLVRCWQDLWAADSRFFVRILFLGQRVVRDGINLDNDTRGAQ